MRETTVCNWAMIFEHACLLLTEQNKQSAPTNKSGECGWWELFVYVLLSYGSFAYAEITQDADRIDAK